jgi:hypothetical protein
MVEVGQGGGEIAANVRRHPAFMAHGRVLQILATFGVQRLGPGVVPVGPLDVTQMEVRRCPVVQGTGLPDQVARARQQLDGGPGVLQSLGIAAQDPQDVGPADQHPTSRDAVAAAHDGVEDR